MAFIGAGSVEFTRNVVTDLMTRLARVLSAAVTWRTCQRVLSTAQPDLGRRAPTRRVGPHPPAGWVRTRNRWEFFLTLGALRIQYGTGSPVNPIAIF